MLPDLERSLFLYIDVFLYIFIIFLKYRQRQRIIGNILIFLVFMELKGKESELCS